MKRFLKRWLWPVLLVVSCCTFMWAVANEASPLQPFFGVGAIVGIFVSYYMMLRQIPPARAEEKGVILWAAQSNHTNRVWLYKDCPKLCNEVWCGNDPLYLDAEIAAKFPALYNLKPNNPPVRVRMEVLG